MKELGLYIHIPFCKSKCFYCDFNSYSNKESIQDEYIDCIIEELELRLSILNEYKVKSIYIGGGTPTYLNIKSMERLFKNLSIYSGEDVEYTCEANPGTLNLEKLACLKENGVNRLSIGLQSWDNRILKKLGRIHNLSDFLKNYSDARSVGFKNINIDLIFSIEGQTIENLENTIDNVLALNPEHLSYYGLIIEEGTPFYEQFKCGKLKEVDEETDRNMYYLINRKLESKGYVHYEISNYAKCGYESRHNIIYWKSEDYLGIGAGAHSCVNGVRFSNEKIPEDYIGKIKNGNLAQCWSEVLSLNSRMTEFMFMGLRMMEGIAFADFKSRFGEDIMNIYGKEIKKLCKNNMIKIKNGKIMLTGIGIDLSNQVFLEFLK